MLNKIIFTALMTCILSFQLAFAAEPNTKITQVQHVEDFSALLAQAKKEKKVILLEMSASYCGFCRKLEAEILNPMIISGDYEDVLIRHLEIDSYYSINMPDNPSMTPSEYAYSKKIFVTPTLLFLNYKNEEVAERIVGINSVDYFGAYVDEALKEGAKKIKAME